MKLAVITTHPIQYYAPIFRKLAASSKLMVKVFYTRGQQDQMFDRGFGKKITWDIPLLDGYEYSFLKNTAKDQGSHHFWGIKNPDLIEELKDWKAEAILVFGWSNYSHLKVMRYFKGKIPIYFRGDSHLLNEILGFKRVLRRGLLRWIYSHVDYAFYVGSNNKQYYLKHGMKEDQLFFAPHAIDNDRFSNLDERYKTEAQLWKNEHEIECSKKVILFCGKFESTKDPLLLLNVAKTMANRKDLIFLLVGNGRLEEKMKEEAVSLSNVRFLEFQNQSRMPIVYRLADVYVLPSRGETWGLAVNEAMACGLPVVVSDRVGCAVDLVEEGRNGAVFPAGNENALVSALDTLLERDLGQMGQKSQEIISSWNFQAIVESIEKNVLK